MRQTPHYLLTDADGVRRLVRENPWATFVSPVAGLVASHYPVLLDESPGGSDPEQIVLLSHFGRPDEVAHELGSHEVLVVVAGPHGYVSSSWYPEGDLIPTWNHVTAHLWGTPEVLSDEENFAVLRRLVDVFEGPLPDGRALADDEEYARRVARGTVGVRLVVDRFDARAKLSQNKAPEVRAAITAQLRGDGPYAHPGLADEMDRVGHDRS